MGLGKKTLDFLPFFVPPSALFAARAGNARASKARAGKARARKVVPVGKASPKSAQIQEKHYCVFRDLGHFP